MLVRVGVLRVSEVIVVTFVLCVLGYHFGSVPVLDAGVCNTLYSLLGGTWTVGRGL